MSHAGPRAPAARILYFGQRHPTNLEASFVRAFRALGCTVDFVDVSGASLPLGREGSPLRRAVMKLARPLLRAGYRVGLPLWARGRRYNLVFCHKPLLAAADTLATIARRCGARLYCFYPDRALDPDPSRATDETRRLLVRVDCFFTFGRFMIDELVAAGARRVELLPFAHDPALHAPPTIDLHDARHADDARDERARATLRCEVAFVGNHSDERASWLRHLLDFDLGVWGHRWERALPLDPRFGRAIRGGAREGRAFAEIYAAADIGLNLIQVYPDGHNMRSFEAPACGAFVLSNRTRELVELFREGEEIACFGTPEELREKVAWYLAHPDERARIARAGLARVAGETYVARAQRILEVLADDASHRAPASADLDASAR